MNWVLNWLKRFTFFQAFLDLTKRITINKKHDISLFLALVFIWRELEDNDIQAESKSVAYNFTLAVFPLIIFLFTLLPYLESFGISQDRIMGFFEQNIPQKIWNGIESTVEDIIGKKRDSLLSFGFLLAMVMSTNGMLALMGAFNRCYKTKENRNYFKKRFIAFILTIALIIVLFLALSLITFGGYILGWLGLEGHEIFGRLLQFIAYIFIFFGAISSIYYFAPSVQKRWRIVSYGTVFATSASILASLAFSYYFTNFANYNEVYGSIGVLIAFMLWVQLMSVILLLGFEINAGIDRAKRFRMGLLK